MKYHVSILTDAEQDIDDAYIWYEMKQAGLGDSFYDCIDASILFLTDNPLRCAEIYKNVRRLVVRKFPFGVYYKIHPSKYEIQIIGVLHFKRNTKILRKRI